MSLNKYKIMEVKVNEVTSFKSNMTGTDGGNIVNGIADVSNKVLNTRELSPTVKEISWPLGLGLALLI